MAGEIQKPNEAPGQLEFEIEFGLGDLLDSYREAQDVYFDACRSYAADFSSEAYEKVETSAFNLEFKLLDTIHAIAARQASTLAKVLLVDGFIIADDAMRTQVLRELVPELPFQAYGETVGAQNFTRNIPAVIQQQRGADVLASLSASAITFLKNDTEAFGEAGALPTKFLLHLISSEEAADAASSA